jgi:hypothetical protein
LFPFPQNALDDPLSAIAVDESDQENLSRILLLLVGSDDPQRAVARHGRRYNVGKTVNPAPEQRQMIYRSMPPGPATRDAAGGGIFDFARPSFPSGYVARARPVETTSATASSALRKLPGWRR